MRFFAKTLRLLVTLFILTACVDSGDSFNPTDPDTVFTLFPSDYFDPGYLEDYELSGFNDNAIPQSGLFSIETQPPVIFDGEPAVPVFASMQVADVQAGLSLTTRTAYFSIDEIDRRYLGTSNLLFGSLTFFALSTSTIPATAKIGDSGEIGTYVDSLANENTRTWQLEDGGDGRAWLIFASTTRDFLGFRLSALEERYLIEPNGERVSIRLRFFDDLFETLTLSGDKI